MLDTNPSGDLLSRTIHLVNHAHRDITLAQMAEEIGVDAAWMTRFRKGHLRDPGVIRVQALHDFLISKQA